MKNVIVGILVSLVMASSAYAVAAATGICECCGCGCPVCDWGR